MKRCARHQHVCDCEGTMWTVGRRASSGTGVCAEAVVLWLNHVYQQASSAEAAGSRRTRLDGLGKRSLSSVGWCQDKIQTRAGGGSQSCERAPAALGMFQTHCDPDGSLLSHPAGGCFIIRAAPAEAEILKCLSFLPPSMFGVLPAEPHVTLSERGRVVWPTYGSWHRQPLLVPIRPPRLDVLKA